MAQSPQKRSVTSRYPPPDTSAVLSADRRISDALGSLHEPSSGGKDSGQGPNRMRGLRLRAATGGCKIPGANMTAKERARQAGIRQVKPAHENMCRLTETTARFGRSASRTVVPCRDDSPLSTLSLKRSLAPLRGKTQNRPPEYSARESGNATRNARGRNSCPIFRNAGR